jgi:hypothetical protein
MRTGRPVAELVMTAEERRRWSDGVVGPSRRRHWLCGQGLFWNAHRERAILRWLRSSGSPNRPWANGGRDFWNGAWMVCWMNPVRAHLARSAMRR